MVRTNLIYQATPNTWFSNTSILCNGKPLGVVGSTKPELQVDIWLANNSFYIKSRIMIDSEG